VVILKNILLIHTGGTLSMETKGTSGLQAKELIGVLDNIVPEINNIAKITHKQLFQIDSSQINIAQIQQIAETLKNERKHYDAFVITHGTDTMAYTASALSFMLRDFGKTIVLTGAQRPLYKPRTDAKINLIDSVIIAVESNYNEIVIVFDSTVYRGVRSSKYKINDYDAFRSFNMSPIGKLGVEIEYYNHAKYINKNVDNFKYYPKLNNNIFVFKVFPGIEFSSFNFLKKPDAIILEAFGAGNLEASDNLIKYIKKNQDTPIIIHSQVNKGRVNLNLYESGMILKGLGAIGSGNITFEALIFKTMHLLSYTKSKKSILRNITKNLVGELDN
jgi:L-asparaginase